MKEPNFARRGGNTPADAGNSSRQRPGCAHRRKHPRRCGELALRCLVTPKAPETPPQMRGTPSQGLDRQGSSRNTPADAGNSKQNPRSLPGIRKHPRRCGELRRKRCKKRKPSETPPQMQGTLVGFREFLRSPGNTPADAGNS